MSSDSAGKFEKSSTHSTTRVATGCEGGNRLLRMAIDFADPAFYVDPHDTYRRLRD